MSEWIQRRNSPRNPVSSLVRVRRPEWALANPKILTAENVSTQGIYLVAESYTIRQRVKLFLSFPTNPVTNTAMNVVPNLDLQAIDREYLAEVVRVDSLPKGRLGVAARLLHNIQLRLRDGLIVPDAGFWMSWPHMAPQAIDFYA